MFQRTITNVLACLLGLAALALTGLPACASSLHHASIGYAKPVSDWDGFNNLFHDGKLYFTGQPTADALRKAPDRQIKVVVNLRSEVEMISGVGFDEASLVQELGIEYVSIPVTAATFSVADADKLKEVLSGTPGPVLIHCGSSNRVGGLWALYLYRHHDFDLDEAIDRGRSAGATKDSIIEMVKRAAAGSDRSAAD